MKYRIGKYIEIDAGNFMITKKDVETDTNKLKKGTIIKIIRASTNYIEFQIFVPVKNKPESAIDYAILNSSVTNNSPAEVVPFDHFIESIEELNVPDLLDENIPMDFWEQGHLLYYIAFLEGQIADKDLEIAELQKPDKEKVREVIQWLMDLRDGTDDGLGKNCMKAVKLLRFIINEGGN